MSAADWPVVVHPIYRCWLWQKALNSSGYGVVWLPGRVCEMAHVAVWRVERGEPPAGKQPDHLCRNRACANPGHVEWVTKAENERRKLWRVRARIRVMPCGHLFAHHGCITPQGGKVCRTCS